MVATHRVLLTVMVNILLGLKTHIRTNRAAICADKELMFPLLLLMLDEGINGLMQPFKFGRLAAKYPLVNVGKAIHLSLLEAQRSNTFETYLENDPRYVHRFKQVTQSSPVKPGSSQST